MEVVSRRHSLMRLQADDVPKMQIEVFVGIACRSMWKANGEPG